MQKLEALPDEEIYKRCQEYGAKARYWTRKFAALLPIVFRRGIYRKKGFISIYEFAKKLAGMNEVTVDRILSLERRISDKPNLLNVFHEAKQGWSKIERVSYIASKKDEKHWAKKVNELPTPSLIKYVEYKRNLASEGLTVEEKESSFNASVKQEDDQQISQDFVPFSIKISEQTQFKLRLIRQKLQKKLKMNLSWNEVLQYLTEGHTPKPKFTPEKSRTIAPNTTPPKPQSRAIPKNIKDAVKKEYNHKCAFPNCNMPFDHFHHINRFSITKSHDVESILPLCKNHHTLLHTSFISNENDPPKKWKIQKETNTALFETHIDQLYLRYLNKASKSAIPP